MSASQFLYTKFDFRSATHEFSRITLNFAAQLHAMLAAERDLCGEGQSFFISVGGKATD